MIGLPKRLDMNLLLPKHFPTHTKDYAKISPPIYMKEL
jgi:hypothetical protein